MNWYPIETMPKGKEVLVITASYEFYLACLSDDERVIYESTNAVPIDGESPTHWTPLRGPTDCTCQCHDHVGVGFYHCFGPCCEEPE